MHVSDMHVFCFFFFVFFVVVVVVWFTRHVFVLSLSCMFLFPVIIEFLKCVSIRVIIASAALRIRRDRRWPRRWARAWIYMYRRRQFGAHHALMEELASETPHSFANFIRMDKQDFDERLTKITPFIQKQDTNMRESITPAERFSDA